ncbi:hypothetical protein [Streptomyces cucumeris]|uniref:hypothetical protein n=1 Tax=Streptomyces cucumeris TaxID=2962890 RepID=UPI003D7661F7
MTEFSYSDLMELDLEPLDTAVSDWKAMVSALDKLRSDVYDGLVAKSDMARWAGINAGVTKDFVRSTAKEFLDLHAEAESIYNILEDAHTELSSIQKQAKSLTDKANAGDPDRLPEADPGLMVTNGVNGKVNVAPICTDDPRGTSQRTKEMAQWYADTLTSLVAHASEIDAAVTRALKRSHGNDPHNAGHATYTSLDEDQIPRATKLASLGSDANDKQRAELRRLWISLSAEARTDLWKEHRSDLLAAGILSPQVKQVAVDRGAGAYDVESPSLGDYKIQAFAKMMAAGGDVIGNTDAAHNMDHYLRGTGTPLQLDVDRMLTDDEKLRQVADQEVEKKQAEWRQQALDAYKKSDGKTVIIPVETTPKSYTHTDRNWYLAIGSATMNTTGVVKVETGHDGKPSVSLDYQVNVWDRYNWDPGKSTKIAGSDVTDADMARLHTTGLAKEFDMRGSGSIQHHELNSKPAELPEPADPGRDGTRTDIGRNGDAR